MVTKADIVSTYNELFEATKVYAELSTTDKIIALQILTAGSGSTGSGGTTDTVTIKDRTTTNKLAIDSEGKLSLNNLFATSTDITSVINKLTDVITELEKKADLTETQPVSLSVIPLATNAATESSLTVLNNKLPTVLSSDRLKVNAIFDVAQSVILSAGTNAIGSITNTTFAVTQSGSWNLANITGTISLPTGAATSAKQPAFGIAGTASSDVLSIQGVVGGVAQTVTGTVSISNSFALDTTAQAIRDRLPLTLGAKTSDASLPVTLSTNGLFATAFGMANDSTANSDSANSGFMSLFKRHLTRQTTLFQGVAGTPNTNVLTIQGITGGTPLTIDNALAPSVGISGTRLITTANTFELLTTASSLKNGIEVQAGTQNVGLLFVRYVGSSDGIALTAGNSRYFPISNTNQIQVSVATANDRVRWMGS